ncbi:UNVERIFIED_ORG: DNA polymerase III subunit chi [Shinella sp. XGS7]|jgi:DNA polymerase-3 subunit chi|nr:DNA polymerase III subunit chi [Shinella sp. XGS7]
MSEISFYTGVPERLPYVCRLLRKAQLSGARLTVLGPATLLERLDRALWEFEPTEFVPHLRLRPEQAHPWAERTPVLLAEQVEDQPHREVLLNLGMELPQGFEGFRRVLEVVAREPEQVEAGRRRFKQYKQLGHEVQHHVVSP